MIGQIEIQLSDDSNSQEIRLSLLSAFENISFILSFNPGFLVLSSPRQEHAGPDLLLSGKRFPLCQEHFLPTYVHASSLIY
ncbi:hypothetical protein ES319_D01G230800v1 [Gossypium barbadense]|uniref:Uncharacterized protein n=1 Tax=Gossypium barbadense TaxID=3634 RepID=A0A5J5SS07_GOSBA|nr:hypothetical protein ES319_D01G230800v1 [Gossypium barbadense]